VLYGSDFPVSHLRGRCVGLGDSFLWISADNTNLEVPYLVNTPLAASSRQSCTERQFASAAARPPCARLELALVGHEALRTLKVAALATRLTDSQVEDIFHNNAAALFGCG
jgi:glutamate-1-semialdehyde 2,1-aminomutase